MATQTIYGLIQDLGDGSSRMVWFRSYELVTKLLDGNSDNEFGDDSFYPNEGSPAETLTFPDTLDLEACGFTFNDEEYDDED